MKYVDESFHVHHVRHVYHHVRHTHTSIAHVLIIPAYGFDYPFMVFFYMRKLLG